MNANIFPAWRARWSTWYAASPYETPFQGFSSRGVENAIFAPAALPEQWHSANWLLAGHGASSLAALVIFKLLSLAIVSHAKRLGGGFYVLDARNRCPQPRVGGFVVVWVLGSKCLVGVDD